MLLHVKPDQLLNGFDRVQCIEVQPLVLEHSPPRFDQRIGEGGLRTGQNSLGQLVGAVPQTSVGNLGVQADISKTKEFS